MNQTQPILPKLRELAGLERVQLELKKNHASTSSVANEMESLRAMMPTSILMHYDSRRARGKMGVAPVSHGICGACHIAIPKGHVAELRRGDGSLSVCENCGVFVYLEEETPLEVDFSQPSARGSKKIKLSPKRSTRLTKV
jgi:predicted  nucleic acid-binding Zn-ribbon protein